MTTLQIGRATGLSQATASRWIVDLVPQRRRPGQPRAGGPVVLIESGCGKMRE